MRFRKKNKSLSRLNSKKIIKPAVLPLIYKAETTKRMQSILQNENCLIMFYYRTYTNTLNVL